MAQFRPDLISLDCTRQNFEYMHLVFKPEHGFNFMSKRTSYPFTEDNKNVSNVKPLRLVNGYFSRQKYTLSSSLDFIFVSFFSPGMCKLDTESIQLIVMKKAHGCHVMYVNNLGPSLTYLSKRECLWVEEVGGGGYREKRKT